MDYIPEPFIQQDERGSVRDNCDAHEVYNETKSEV